MMGNHSTITSWTYCSCGRLKEEGLIAQWALGLQALAPTQPQVGLNADELLTTEPSSLSNPNATTFQPNEMKAGILLHLLITVWNISTIAFLLVVSWEFRKIDNGIGSADCEVIHSSVEASSKCVLPGSPHNSSP